MAERSYPRFSLTEEGLLVRFDCIIPGYRDPSTLPEDHYGNPLVQDIVYYPAVAEEKEVLFARGDRDAIPDFLHTFSKFFPWQFTQFLEVLQGYAYFGAHEFDEYEKAFLQQKIKLLRALVNI